MKKRIKQFISGSANMFQTAFIEKYNMEPYVDTEKPTVFLGCYFDRMLKSIIRHQGFGLAIWRGVDISWAIKARPEYINEIRNKNNIFHIAITNFIEQKLEEAGLPYISLPVVPLKNEDISPQPLGDKVYAYNAESVKYGGHIFEQLKRRLPWFTYVICNYKTYTREELLDIYKSCFIGIRFTTQDGLSNTVVELGLMGRRVIWNGNTPNAIPFKESEIGLIAEVIQREYDIRERIDYNTIAKDMYEYINISDDFLYVDNYS